MVGPLAGKGKSVTRKPLRFSVGVMSPDTVGGRMYACETSLALGLKGP